MPLTLCPDCETVLDRCDGCIDPACRDPAEADCRPDTLLCAVCAEDRRVLALAARRAS